LLVVFIVGVLAVLSAYRSRKNNSLSGLKISIGLVFFFLALRYDFGNDYMSYLNIFNDINGMGSFNPGYFFIKGNEFGWLYLNRLFGLGGLSFFTMIAALALLNCYVLYKFIKKYVSPRYYWFAIFLYIFHPYNMLVLSSAMRQALAFSIFLFSIDFIVQKKIGKYFFFISIATLFHTSAVFLFPLILLSLINWKIKFFQIISIGVLFVVPIIFTQEIFDQIYFLVSEYFDYYSGYIKEVHLNTKLGAGFALNVLIYLVVIFYSQLETAKNHSILFKIGIVSFLMIPLSFGVPLITRLNFYLIPVMMAVFPYVFEKIKSNEIRISYITVILLFTLYNFYIFFESDTWRSSFMIYKTIFSS